MHELAAFDSCESLSQNGAERERRSQHPSTCRKLVAVERETESRLAQHLRSGEVAWIASSLHFNRRCVLAGRRCRFENHAEPTGAPQPLRRTLT